MLSAFGEISKNFKLKPKQRTLDNVFFKLHYRLTFLILIVSTILVCSRQYIGEHIRCMVDMQGSFNIKVVETFCFFSSTFTVARHLNSSVESWVPGGGGGGGSGVGGRLHPGVGPFAGDEEVLHHAYYQWVPFVLFGQALMFYAPHWLWRKMEGGTLMKMAEALHNSSLVARGRSGFDVEGKHIMSEEERNDKIDKVRRSYLDRLQILESWGRWFVLCELLNMVNAVGQIFLTNAFLAGRFLALGPALIARGDSVDDPLDVVFPKMTKCVFRKFGPSGSVQNYDALCVMALNIINEKIYAFLWFWLVALAAATALGLLWRALTFCLHRSTAFSVWIFRSVCPGPVDHRTLGPLTQRLCFSNWLFLLYLGKNLDGFVFQRLLLAVSEELAVETRGSGPGPAGRRGGKASLNGSSPVSSPGSDSGRDSILGARVVKYEPSAPASGDAPAETTGRIDDVDADADVSATDADASSADADAAKKPLL